MKQKSNLQHLEAFCSSKPTTKGCPLDFRAEKRKNLLKNVRTTVLCAPKQDRALLFFCRIIKQLHIFKIHIDF